MSERTVLFFGQTKKIAVKISQLLDRKLTSVPEKTQRAWFERVKDQGKPQELPSGLVLPVIPFNCQCRC